MYVCMYVEIIVDQLSAFKTSTKLNKLFTESDQWNRVSEARSEISPKCLSLIEFLMRLGIVSPHEKFKLY